MTRASWLFLACLFSLLQGAARVRAEAGLESHALVIGSNQGGSGQWPLAYAEGDAERIAQLFRELGRTPLDNITLLQKPTPSEVEDALGTLRKRLESRKAAGVKTQVLFYYSGHARAQGLSLGDQELPLDTLRTALWALPSTLTVVVLDACQSGAFSGVKGASPAADFSVSSVHGLHNRGMAVMASSTGSELSQESPELTGSYFTHHLTVALRGAGDVDGNGRVSLDEAYRYAYENTLSDTARTQVGMQHATLETNVTGRGDVALTYPADADALLVLPPELTGRVLVQRAGHGAVMAELLKVGGAPLWLALPSGRYDVLLRDSQRSLQARECNVQLARGQAHSLQTTACREITLPDPNKKGEQERHEVWFLELGISGSQQKDDDYIDTLEQFRYEPRYRVRVIGNDLRPADRKVFMEGALGFAVHPNISLLLRYDSFEHRSFYRRLAGPRLQSQLQSREDVFDWHTMAVSLGVRGRLRLWHEYIVAVAELSLGVALAGTSYRYSGEDGDTASDLQLGPALRSAAGFTFGFNDHFGFYLMGGYALVRALSNDIGDTHDDGGFFGSFGLRLKSLKWWW